ncbi:MAG: AAA family ATPase [Oscillospiraceae bacterium]|nr:AAA family ATPase [Oscillospiraceae bacterium]
MDGAAVGNRIIVLGCPGSGKTTLAESLHARTGLPLFHLDSIWWKADRTHISREEFDRRLQTILHGERWIIDGDYSRTYEPRFSRCDTVVFLDCSEEECMAGIRERVGKPRPDMPWTEERLDPELTELVRRYRAENRPALVRLIGKYPDRRVFIFKTRAQAQAWVSRL